MSLLWPDKVAGGLFPGQCWLKRAGGQEMHAHVQPGTTVASSLLGALEEMLDGQGSKLRKGSKVSLVVSDGMGAVVTLPWQAQLTAPDEVRRYAQACFEKQGIDVGDWALHADFRIHGAMGLAHALPKDWLIELATLLEARGLHLDRVLPVTAMAYWRAARFVKSGQEIVLLREPQRISALVFDRAGLQAIDVEANTGDADDACRRLLRRLCAYYPDVALARDWASSAEHAATPTCVAACLSNAILVAVERGAWS